MTNGKKVLEDLRAPARELRSRIPDVYSGFAAMHKATFTPGALDTKTKELIAIAVGVSSRCDGCIASHARAVAKAGATPDEVAEAIAVALLLSGGPGTVYGPRAIDAFMDFYEPPADAAE